MASGLAGDRSLRGRQHIFREAPHAAKKCLHSSICACILAQRRSEILCGRCKLIGSNAKRIQKNKTNIEVPKSTQRRQTTNCAMGSCHRAAAPAASDLTFSCLFRTNCFSNGVGQCFFHELLKQYYSSQLIPSCFQTILPYISRNIRNCGVSNYLSKHDKTASCTLFIFTPGCHHYDFFLI